jgi:hypothetical protein
MNDLASATLQVPTMHDEAASRNAKAFVPGTPDIWFFVFFEAFLFTAYFTVYMVRRMLDVDLFLQSQTHLSLATGVINTLILLVSSWSMARCAQAAREGAVAAARRNLLLTVAFALAFFAVKILLLSHRHPLHSPADRIRLPRRGRASALATGAIAAGDRDRRDLLAHGRLPVDHDFRAAVPDEVADERRI